MKKSDEAGYDSSPEVRSEGRQAKVKLASDAISNYSPEAHRLAIAASQGNAEAFGELYGLYARPIFTYCAYRLAVKADAEDLTAQVFLRAWKGIRLYNPETGPFLNWLYQIAHNLVINHYKSRRNQAEVADASLDEFFIESIPADHNPEVEVVEDLLRRMQKNALRQAMGALPEEQQQVLFFRFVEEWSHAQIADFLHKKEGTVRAIQFRAVATLSKTLAKEGHLGEQKQ